MKLVQLTRGMFAKIDDEDFDRVMTQGRWQAVAGLHTWYAATSFKIPGTRKNRKVLLHRFLMNCIEGDGKRVDHKNEDGLDCQKDNLQISSASLNAFNRKYLLANNNSGVDGVYWNKQKMRWVGEIIWQKRKIYCGSDVDIEIVKELRENIKNRLLAGDDLDKILADRRLKPPTGFAQNSSLVELTLEDF